MAIALEIAHLSKKFDAAHVALENINLKVKANELLAILGPSGSGKTTLLRIIAGLEFADQGTVLFDGTDVSYTPVGERQIGFVFQNYALFRHMTVFENIAFGLRVRPRKNRPSEAQIKKRVLELLDLMQLPDLSKRYPSQISGGQRQRIALARALAIEPKVLLLDEPFGALDAKVRKDLRQWIRKIQKSFGITTILVTHDQEEALEIADQIAIMNSGRIEQTGTPQEVYDNPVNAFVIDFFGDANCIITSGQQQVYVRKYDIEIHRNQNAASTLLTAIVQHIHTAGPLARIELTTPGTNDPIKAEISRHKQEQLRLKPGDQVFLEMHQLKLIS